MAYDAVHIGDYGWVLKVDTGSTTDISLATTFEILVEKPDGTTATLTGAVSGTRYITWTATANYFTLTGEYQMRAKVTWATPAVLYGDRFTLRVTG